MEKAIKKLEEAIGYIQYLHLANEDDEKRRDWAISCISEIITELTSKEPCGLYEKSR